MSLPTRPLAELTEQAIHVLVRELGIANTARFLHQFGAGYGDYVAEKRVIFGKLSLEEVLKQSQRFNKDNTEEP